jgi:hypothetical protein
MSFNHMYYKFTVISILACPLSFVMINRMQINNNNNKLTQTGKELLVSFHMFSSCVLFKAPTIPCWDTDHIAILPLSNLPKVRVSSEGTLCSQKCCHSTHDTQSFSQTDLW